MHNKRFLNSFALLLGTASWLSAGPVAYVTSATAQFGTLDLGTGAFQLIGATPTALSGLGRGLNGAIYGLDASNNLITIDPNNAAVVVRGNTGLPIPAGGNPIFGSLSGGLFALDAANFLYSIDPTSAAATPRGSTGIAAPDFSTCNCISANSLAGGAGNLFFTYEIFSLLDSHVIAASSLYRINPLTGVATAVGATGSTLGIVGLGFVDGTLYGFASDINNIQPSQILSLNTSTGGATFIANPASNLDPVFGVTSETPEPGTWILVGSCLAGLAIVKLRAGSG